MRAQRLTALVLALGVAWGCSKDPKDGGAAPPSTEGEFRTSSKNDVQWKRYSALEADLIQALELGKDEVCTELGRANCIHEVHLVPLGGNEPFETGLLQPSNEPLATTPSVVDRILLSACGQRVALDQEAGPDEARVFREFDLTGSMPAKADSRVRATIVELYRRLLARDPDPLEVELVRDLAEDADGEPIAAAEFAKAACFAIGSTTEFLFF